MPDRCTKGIPLYPNDEEGKKNERVSPRYGQHARLKEITRPTFKVVGKKGGREEKIPYSSSN